MLLFNDCGVIELDIASELYSIERFGHVDLHLLTKVYVTGTFNRIEF